MLGALLAVACKADVVEPVPQGTEEEESDDCEGVHSCFGFLVLLSHAEHESWETLLPEVQEAFPELECGRNVVGTYDVLCYPTGMSCGFEEEADALALEQRFIEAYGDDADTFVEGCACRGYC